MRKYIDIEIIGNGHKSLLEQLAEKEVYLESPCGGVGNCGKCKVQMLEGVTQATKEDVYFFSNEELEAGWRLACHSYPEEACSVRILSHSIDDFKIVDEYRAFATIEESDNQKQLVSGEDKFNCYCIAVDIGTTTIAMCLIDKNSGCIIDRASIVNSQRIYGADVISRIKASNDGKKDILQECIRSDLKKGIDILLNENNLELSEIEKIIVAANTTMCHILMGYDCQSLGVTPFTPVNINTINTSFGGVEMIIIPGITTYVGADITAGLLSCDFDQNEKVNVLIDVGTNGEMAIGNKDKILVASTAAGPAFEGGNISSGVASVSGAICGLTIDVVEQEDIIKCQTINDELMNGICGTGVIEVAYELLKCSYLDSNGILADKYFEDGYKIGVDTEGNSISFTQADVQEIQLAKSAIRAGLETLIHRYGVSYEQIEKLYIAGGFGHEMNIAKAVGIGLFPKELVGKAVAIGNSALAGAIRCITDSDGIERAETIVKKAEEIALSNDEEFGKLYMDYMFFE